MSFVKDELIAQYYLTQPEDLGDEYEWVVFRKILLKQGEYHVNTGDTMKTIKTLVENTMNWKKCPIGTLIRCRDKDARRIVNNKEGVYAPKHEWKESRNEN